MPSLLEIISQEMKLRNYSPKTIKAYTSVVTQLYQHTKKPPKNLSTEEIKQFLLSMQENGNPAKPSPFALMQSIFCSRRSIIEKTLQGFDTLNAHKNFLSSLAEMKFKPLFNAQATQSIDSCFPWPMVVAYESARYSVSGFVTLILLHKPYISSSQKEKKTA